MENYWKVIGLYGIQSTNWRWRYMGGVTRNLAKLMKFLLQFVSQESKICNMNEKVPTAKNMEESF